MSLVALAEVKQKYVYAVLREVLAQRELDQIPSKTADSLLSS